MMVTGEKQFSKDTVFQAHLTGKKHKKAYEKLQKESASSAVPAGDSIPLLEKKVRVSSSGLPDRRACAHSSWCLLNGRI
jgi:hypothetical protein